jgi:uncharacterized protein (DUF983 family)
MSPALPAAYSQAALRGVRCRCPRCGEGRLFRKWLKPLERCPVCMLDLTPQRADDFPAYIAMIVTGHLMAPLIITLSKDFHLGPAAMFGMLQPAKGAVIATQWWFGMHGFRKERPEPLPIPAEPDGVSGGATGGEAGRE